MIKKIEAGEKAMADKMVAALMSKVGCKRRMFSLKDVANHIKKTAAKVGTAIKTTAVKVGKAVKATAVKVGKVVKGAAIKVKAAVKKVAPVVEKIAEKIAPAALKMACSVFGSQCPKACDDAIDQVVPMMKNYKIPSKCFSTTAKDVCHQACTDLCKAK